MRSKQKNSKASAERVVEGIRRQTRKQYSAEEKIRIVLEGLRGDDTIAELCRCEGIAQDAYYKWSKDFMEAGKKRLAGDTMRAANNEEVTELRREGLTLKEVVAGELADWLKDQKMSHVRGAPFHPQTQGKIERWHQTLKNRILLENYYLPGDLEAQIEVFVEHYNYQRYHESLKNVTPADAYFGRAQAIIKQRERIKRKTIGQRRLHHQRQAA